MRSTVVVDANVILRYLLEDHPEHSSRAKEFMERVRHGGARAFIPEGVVVECVYVLLKVYSVPRKEVADKLGELIAYKGIVGNHCDILVESLRLFGEKNVDIVDAIVHVTAQRRGWDYFSFDKDLKKPG